MRKISHLAYLFMFRSLRQAFSGKKPDVRVPHAKGLPLTDREQFGEEAESSQWIGVDLDGTLAEGSGRFQTYWQTDSQYDEAGQDLVGNGIPCENRNRTGSKSRGGDSSDQGVAQEKRSARVGSD